MKNEVNMPHEKPYTLTAEDQKQVVGGKGQKGKTRSAMENEKCIFCKSNDLVVTEYSCSNLVDYYCNSCGKKFQQKWVAFAPLSLLLLYVTPWLNTEIISKSLKYKGFCIRRYVISRIQLHGHFWHVTVLIIKVNIVSQCKYNKQGHPITLYHNKGLASWWQINHQIRDLCCYFDSALLFSNRHKTF